MDLFLFPFPFWTWNYFVLVLAWGRSKIGGFGGPWGWPWGVDILCNACIPIPVQYGLAGFFRFATDIRVSVGRLHGV